MPLFRSTVAAPVPADPRPRRLWLGLLVLAAMLLPACRAAPRGETADDVRRELRGVWVATVANIDWPSRKDLDVPRQRQEMLAILDRARELNLNAVFLQVRPACDAIYPSALEPWSEFITGEQGRPPADGFDPLAEWIAAAHQRGLELHAWFNPYRTRHPSETSPAAASHVSVAHRGWVRRFDNLLWLDPGDAEAREHSLAVITDVVARYDIDGVHLDDYFYPYPKKGVDFDDASSYAVYTQAGGTLALDDWRRDNVDTFVREMHERTRRIKPWVTVSISPFGIWRPGHPDGITGFDAYAGLYADAARWMREGWVDLLIPQIYWRLSSKGQPHASLVEWWAANNPRRRTLAIGLIPSRVAARAEGESAVIDTRVWPATEIVNQIVRGRETAGVHGYVLFSAKPLVENREGLADALREGVAAAPALTPERAWSADSPRPPRPQIDLAPETSAIRVTAAMPRPLSAAHRLVVRAEYPGSWLTFVAPAGDGVSVPRQTPSGSLRAIHAAWCDRFGRVGTWTRRSAPAE